ncbi:MAG TPA: hypothetical protein VEK79_07390 [Thermoanaerobaculia bacterium]|nr:hypothetical protein [Thermoanaerobaculia bacterium]
MNRTTKTTLQYVTLALAVPVPAAAMFLSFVFPLPSCKATWTGHHRGSTIRAEVVMTELAA